MKWGFLPPPDGGPRYLVVNADESEPGTCKDIPLMMAAPQFLIEGVVITSFAIGCNHAFIYLRGEVVHVYRRLLRAVEEAYAAGYLGKNILGSGFDLEVTVHAGAGAYICGEETALLDSLEGRRGQPRLKPPFPAVAGLYARPTVVNNVESIASVPVDPAARRRLVHRHGHREVHRLRHLQPVRPRQAPRPVRGAARHHAARAARHGRRHARRPTQLKFWTPGGSSTPIFTDEHLDVPLDFESVGGGRARCSAPARCRSSTRPPAWCAPSTRWTDFYAHESCGKCTPCREGTCWLKQILERLEHGQGTEDDIDKLLDICDNILGRVVLRPRRRRDQPDHLSIQYFRDEFEAGMHTPTDGGCPFDRAHSDAVREGDRCPHDRHHQPQPRAATPSTRAATRRSRRPSTWSP